MRYGSMSGFLRAALPNPFLLLLAFAFFSSVVPTCAQSLDQSLTVNQGFFARFGVNAGIAQSFVQDHNTISGASVLTHVNGTGTGSVTIELYDNLPPNGGERLAGGTVDGVTAGDWATVNFGQVVQIVAGQTYFLVISGSNPNMGVASTDGLNNGTDYYPLGQGYHTNYSPITGDDIDFKTYYSDIELLDPVGLSKTGFACDPTSISSMAGRMGTIADGLSALLLVAKSSQALSFSLADTSAGNGSVTTCNGKSPATLISPVGDTNSVVVAVYIPPDGFGTTAPDPTTNARLVTIIVQGPDGSTAPKSIQLERPPLVLLHGFNSSPTVWTSFQQDLHTMAQGFYGKVTDYGSWDSFRPGSLSTQVLKTDIAHLIAANRNSGIASSSVDVVAHSMGGLVARSFSVDPAYASSDNYWKGSIHRLVTIGTPHLGTAAAGKIEPVLQVLRGASGQLLINWFFGASLDSAVADLVPGSSAIDEIESLEQNMTAPFHWHAIAGDYLPGNDAALGTVDAFWSFLFLSTSVVFDGQPNDLLVNTASALRGAPSPAGQIAACGGTPVASSGVVSYFTGVIHSTSFSPLDPTVCAEIGADAILLHVVDLLSGPTSAFFSGPPSSLEVMAMRNRSQANAPMRAVDEATASLEFLNPAESATVVAGAGQTLTVSVQASDNRTLQHVVFIVGGLGIFPASASAPNSVTIPLDSAGFGPAGILGLANDATGAIVAGVVHVSFVPESAPVSLQVSPQTLTLDNQYPVAKLDVEAAFADGSIVPFSQAVTYTSSNSGVVSVDPTGVVHGVASGTGVVRVAYGAFTVDVPVTASNLPLPNMTLDTKSLNFAATTTSVAFASATSPQSVRLAQSGNGVVAWLATPDQPWIHVSPASGSGSQTITISIDYQAGLPMSGIVTGAVMLSYSGASSVQDTISVSLSLTPTGMSAPPFGSFDTPVNGSDNLAGSVAVTGWALDDVQVTRVTVCRDGFEGETPSIDPNCGGASKVYIGDAVLIDGARPDVEAAYPAYPLNSRAGWGYLMLTNFLPNLGNGTFTLRAYAFDGNGHVTALGSRTITCDNAHALAPFGAIDTPGQGQVVSGLVNNFGWVLSPGLAKADPLDGGMVSVLVDGVPVGSPGGWTARSDLSALFSAQQYSGVANALGVFGLDTTTLSDGLHTIAWVVTANDGRTSGVGSRFFTVFNGAALRAGQASSALGSEKSSLAAIRPPNVFVTAAPVAGSRTGILEGRVGPELEGPLQTFTPNSEGLIVIEGQELDRFELRFEPGTTGVMQTSTGGRPLPAGSNLDPITGVFTWQPGAGFVGSYDLLFTRAGHPRNVRIVLHPKRVI